jgi:type VI secretion system secreted protein VgrG
MSETLDLLTISTPLPDTSFYVGSISGSERLSRPYGYIVHLHSGTELLDPDRLLDQAVSVHLASSGDTAARYFSGIVRSVRQMPSQSTTVWDYQISIVPKLWFLGQTRDVRYYQKKTVPDIVKSILSDFSVIFSDRLTKTYAQRDYLVMFNESYLAFIQRLLEFEGIFYFFTQDANGHTMVLADANTAFANIAHPSVGMDEGNSGFGCITSWHQEDRTTLGVVRTDDYNPETDEPVAGAITGSETTVLRASGAQSRKHYAWPAVHNTTPLAGNHARIRMLAAEAAARMFTGHGEVLDFVAGGKFTLDNDPAGIGTYVIQSVSYHVRDSSDGAGLGGAGSISMSVSAFPADTEWHEEQSIAPPVMGGIYTAKVIGAAGEEIYTDDLGRIQVKFPSDHMNDITTDNTLFVRVVQPWAGNNWGAHFIPRIGMEVAVAFLEGDVNRPVVIGALVNTNNPPVFAKTDKNKTGFRTRSTLNGGSDNFNELSWDDTTGSEVFFLHAEKDYKLEVENDATYTIEHDRSVTVTNDEIVTVKGKKTDTVTGDFATTVQQGDHSLTVSSGNQAIEVTQGSIHQTAGQSINLKVMGNSLVIDESGITLTVGGNSIQITESGITIKGMMVDVEGESQTSLKGAIVQVQGEGMLDMTGGVTMINS